MGLDRAHTPLRVEAAMRELRSVPNMAAGSFARAHTWSVGDPGSSREEAGSQ